ncbi:MAG: hypothetical protein K2H64_06770 [Desulfovibrio sp.]|nr:hypothetical protein [Desulfovibrio sp.]
MAFKFFGWGRWGDAVVSRYKFARQDASGLVSRILESDTTCGHFPDPIASEAYFNENVRRWSASFALSDPVCRIHFANPGENFASGALANFLKNRIRQPRITDVVIAYLPPFGSNSAGVGRFLANALGSPSFADLFLCLDSSAPIFNEGDEWSAVNYAVGLGRLFIALERSGCILPLLRGMKSRIIASAFADNRELNSSCSLEALWRSISIKPRPGYILNEKIKKALFLSVSESGQFNIENIIRRNMDSDKYLFLPFEPRYEWKKTIMPSPEERGKETNFTGVFRADMTPPLAEKYLYEYYDAYWPEETDSETPAPEIMEWMARNRLPLPEKISQNLNLLKRALIFARDNA